MSVAFIDYSPTSSASPSPPLQMDSNSGYTDEDLLASLAGFAVEGQTERDLSTIKAMLSQYPQLAHHHHSQSQLLHCSPAQSLAISLPFQQQSNPYGFNNNSYTNDPPPNTPTLNRGLELHGVSNSEYYKGPASLASSSGSGGGYFPNTAPGNPPSAFGPRRRDVSLDRSYSASISRQQHFLPSSSSFATSAGGPATSPVNSLQNPPLPEMDAEMDMEMEEENQQEETAAPIQHSTPLSSSRRIEASQSATSESDRANPFAGCFAPIHQTSQPDSSPPSISKQNQHSFASDSANGKHGLLSNGNGNKPGINRTSSRRTNGSSTPKSPRSAHRVEPPLTRSRASNSGTALASMRSNFGE